MKCCLWGFIPLVLVGCGEPSGQIIAKIPEASGISYCSNSDTLIVANDEGSYYEISKEGKILHQIKLGNYDFEGIVCEEDTLIFALENQGLLMVDRKTGVTKTILVDESYQGKKLSLFGKKAGVEGIAKVDNMVYLAKQSKKKKESFIAVVKLMPYPSLIIDVVDHHIADTAGLSYHEGYLYMVSDKEDLLIKYDLQKKETLQKVKLGEGAWEGIALDGKGNVYLADDDGRVLKYKKKALGL
ncbi:SdiA-regulated domain-containing protein [Sulfurovum sp.]|uniref:SdiA-regulated domain-containing protein n=1 Tax=Sulfurovum sp. TaxID=1969726 RepID=UPI002867EC95|nr:SdiA-regulated domain-containing protein [Sulfurovum sp.]